MKNKDLEKPNSPKNINYDEIFPLSSQSGAPILQINSKLMRELTDKHKILEQKEFEKILKQHIKYLKSGNEQGIWQTLLITDLVQGLYVGGNYKDGKQADFSHQNLTNIKIQRLDLSNSNFLATIGENLDVSNSNFENCLFTDAYWQNANFENCIFNKTDFSRADLRNCNFKFADLQDTDFENCNLEGADFTGANLTNSRFPGANIKNIIF